MSRVLLAAHPTVGHTNALRAIGVRLREQGHHVGFSLTVARLPFGDRLPEPMRAALRLPEGIAKDGLEVLPLTPALATLWHGARIAGKTGYAELETALALFTSGMERQATELAEHARRWKAQLLVGDYLMPGAQLGAQLAGIPFVALYHSALPFPAAGAAPFGSGLPDGSPRGPEWLRAEAALEALSATFDRKVAKAVTKLGLPALRPGLLTRPLSTTLNLLATTAELEPGLEPLEGPVVMTGPCLPRAAATEDDASLHVFDERSPRAYVSLGTVFNGQPKVFEAILDGLDCQVVVSAGASFERLAHRAGPKTHLFVRVPQVPLLGQVDFVITHGGNNTVQECLAAGRPMIVIPFGGDQLANARRVERLRCGVAIMPAELNAARVRAALESIRSESIVSRARELGASLAGLDGTGRAVAAILAATSA